VRPPVFLHLIEEVVSTNPWQENQTVQHMSAKV